jgi:hypothetical protein
MGLIKFLEWTTMGMDRDWWFVPVPPPMHTRRHDWWNKRTVLWYDMVGLLICFDGGMVMHVGRELGRLWL